MRGILEEEGGGQRSGQAGVQESLKSPGSGSEPRRVVAGEVGRGKVRRGGRVEGRGCLGGEVGRRPGRVKQVSVSKEVGTGLGQAARGCPGGGRCRIAGGSARAAGQPKGRDSRQGGGGRAGGGSDKGPGAGRRGQSGAVPAAVAMGMLNLPGFLSCGKKKVRRPGGGWPGTPGQVGYGDTWAGVKAPEKGWGHLGRWHMRIPRQVWRHLGR